MHRKVTKGRARARARTPRAKEEVMPRIQKAKGRSSQKVRTMARARTNRRATTRVMDRRARKVKEKEDLSRPAIHAANQDTLPVTPGEHDRLQMVHPSSSSSRVRETLHRPGPQRVEARQPKNSCCEEDRGGEPSFIGI